MGALLAPELVQALKDAQARPRCEVLPTTRADTLGVTHTQAPADVREQLAFVNADNARAFLLELCRAATQVCWPHCLAWPDACVRPPG